PAQPRTRRGGGPVRLPGRLPGGPLGRTDQRRPGLRRLLALRLLPAVLPRGAEKPSAAHRARLALAEAAGAVLAGGLSLLGIDAPQHL
ncbi:DALR anticodon-binding domain-containing protein, partial [Streptomyces griseorubiginosus]|uniref:DALR anticodon-binding domain-containing protein n=1 Tax=Streptomyces griseorubiginosus TaxID=67304 RepID=UPI003F7580B0